MSLLATLLLSVALPPDLRAEREPGVPYDPFDGQSADARMRVFAEGVPPGAILTAEPAAGAPLVFTAPGAVLPYRLATGDGPNAGANTGPDDRVSVPLTAAADESAEAEIRLLVDPGPVVPPGSYEAGLDFRLLAEDGTILTELLDVTAAINVPARAQAIIAGTSGAFDPQASVAFVDFGTLETGETRQLFVSVRANTSAVVTITSENGGVMTLRGDAAASAPDAPGAAYSVDLDGTVSDLATPLSVVRAPPVTAQGAAYPMTITIGAVEQLFAGTYRDDLTIEVRPQ